MSLIKRGPTSEKKIAANRRNRKLCHDSLSDEGRERIRAANLHHGYYAESEEAALRALGEDPAQFDELLAGLWETYQPTDAAQEGLVIQLAWATWLMNRAIRMQEGYAVRQAQDLNRGRQNRLHAEMMRMKLTADSLRLLAQAVAREHYVTLPKDLETMKNLRQDGVLKDLGEIAIALFYQLQPPDGPFDPREEYEKAQRVVQQVKDIFGVGRSRPPFQPAPAAIPVESEESEEEPEEEEPPKPSSSEAAKAQRARHDSNYPMITAADWEARELPRQLLENILKREVEICEEQRQVTLKELVKGPSRHERAAEIAPTHPNARLMRTMQDTNFREIRRATNLLLKLKRYEQKMENARLRKDGKDKMAA